VEPDLGAGRPLPLGELLAGHEPELPPRIAVDQGLERVGQAHDQAERAVGHEAPGLAHRRGFPDGVDQRLPLSGAAEPHAGRATDAACGIHRGGEVEDGGVGVLLSVQEEEAPLVMAGARNGLAVFERRSRVAFHVRLQAIARGEEAAHQEHKQQS